MLRKLSVPLQLVVKIFLIAFSVNAIVTTFHLVHNKDFSFFIIFQIFFYSLGISALFFTPVCLVFFLLASRSTTKRGKIFWIILWVGIVLTFLIYTIFRDVFLKYTNSPETLATIALFSILVSVSSQYEFFVYDHSEHTAVDK